MSALLKTNDLTAFYGDFQALFLASILRYMPVKRLPSSVRMGQEKSTFFLKSITGLLKASKDAVQFGSEPIGGMAPGKNCKKRGIAMVPEGRRLFPQLICGRKTC
ncbi:hypothetical protein ACFS07_33555 [Undibacterium arcticum]